MSAVAALPTITYAEAMTRPIAVVASTAGALGIRPSYLQVSCNQYQELVHDRPWHVSVQVDDVYDADRLAAHYGLLSDDGVGANYTRQGVAVLDGIGEVTVRVYTGRPAADGVEVAR